MNKIISALASSVVLATAASASVAQPSTTNRAVQGFIATTADKPAKGGVIGFIATTADEQATGPYKFVDHLMNSLTSEGKDEVSEKAVLEPVLYSFFSRLERKSCAEIPGIGSIAGQDPPTFRRYKVHVVTDEDKVALVRVFSRNRNDVLDLKMQLRKIHGNWKIFDVCSVGEDKPHYCYRSEVKNWKC